MDRGRETVFAALFALAVFAASFLLLHDAPLFLPHQGVQSVLAADSLMAGRGFEVAPGAPFAKFGPLYPLLLAAFGMLGVEATPALYAINCAALAATLFAIFVLGRTLGVRATAAVVLFSCVWAPNYYLLRAARPDLLAIAFALLGLAGMVAYAARPAIATLVVTALLCSAAATTRYVAVLTLLPVFGVAVVSLRGVGWRRRIADLALFGAVAGGPVLLWMLRNYHVTGYVTGLSRTVSRAQWAEHYGLAGNVLGFLKTIYLDAFAYGAVGTRRVVYGEQPLPWPGLAAAGAVVACGALAAVAWRARHAVRRRIGAAPGRPSESAIAAAICGTYFVLYAAGLIVVWTLSNNDPIETRYVAPLYGLLLLAIAGLLDLGADPAPAAHDAPARHRRLDLAAIVLVAAIAGVPNAAKSARLLSDAPPGPTYLPIGVIGPRGNNWVPSLTWAAVGRAHAGAGAASEDAAEP